MAAARSRTHSALLAGARRPTAGSPPRLSSLRAIAFDEELLNLACVLLDLAPTDTHARLPVLLSHGMTGDPWRFQRPRSLIGPIRRGDRLLCASRQPR